MKKQPTESYIVEIARRDLPVLGQVLHLAIQGGIAQAESILKDLAIQTQGLHPDKPQMHLVYPRAALAPDNAKEFNSCLYVDHKER